MSMKRNKKGLLIGAGVLIAIMVCCVLILAVTAYVSYQTSTMYWDGGYPTGEFRLRVVNEIGDPVEGACLDLYNESGTPAVEYPIYEYDGEGTLCGGADGVITAHQPQEGIQFGGSEWYLFWVIPIGASDAPQFDIRISADGYQDYPIGIWDLFDDTQTLNQQTITYDYMGMDVEMLVYQHTITLERQQ